MKLIELFNARVDRLVNQPRAELNRGQRTVVFLYDLTRHLIREMKADNAYQMAAALTYWTLFSLIPMIVLALVVLQAWRGLENYQDQFKNLIISAALPPALLEADLQSGKIPNTEDDENAAAEQADLNPDAAKPSITLPPITAPKLIPQAKRNPVTPQAPTPNDNASGTPTSDPTVAPQPPPADNASATAETAANGDSLPTDAVEPGSVNAQQEREIREDQLDEARNQLGFQIESTLDELSNVNFSSIGVVGLLVFIFGATALLATIERAFNAIFGVDRNRPWYLRLTYYYTVITLAPIVLITGQVAQQNFLSMIESGLFQWLSAPMVFVSPLVTTWIVFLLLYLVLPRTKVQLKAAAIGSFVSALLWLLGKELFAVYAARTAASRSLYGALGLVPLFLMWVYITWWMLLFGLELTYAIQAMATRLSFKTEDHHAENSWVCDPRWALPILALVAKRFATGQTTTADDIREHLGLPDRAVQKLTTKLADGNYLRTIEADDDNPAGFVLARPASLVQLSTLIKLEHEISESAIVQPQSSTQFKFVKMLHAAACDKAGQSTLEDMLDVIPTTSTEATAAHSSDEAADGPGQ